MGKRFIFSLMVFLLPVAFWARLGSALEKVRLATSVKDNPTFYLPILAGQEKEIWKKQGLEVEWVPFRAGGEMAPAVAGGHVGIGITTAVLATQWLARAFPVIVVGAWDLKEEWSLWVVTDSPLKKPMDLKGTRIGITRRGAIADSYSRAVVKALGIEKEVKFVAVGGLAEQMAALKARRVESSPNGILVIAELAYRGEVRPLVRVDDYLPREWVMRVLTARKDYLKENGETVKRLIKASLEAREFVKGNPAWTVEKLKSQARLSEGAAKMVQASFVYSPDGRIERKALENVTNFLDEYGVVPKEKLPPLEQMYTNEYVP